MAILAKPTQEFVPIKEIRDGVVVLKDGSYRMILMASTLNFSLKSDDEQTAIVMQYQNFLNSLDFPVQFFMQSRKFDIGPYISSLQKAGKEQPNELLKIQIKEYTEFVRDIVKNTNIVSKTFYVVVPYKANVLRKKGGFLENLGLGGGYTSTAKAKIKGSDEQFEEDKLQIRQRADAIRQGLVSAGVKTVPLDTDELVELFYKLFNPGELEKEAGAIMGGVDQLKT